jgi:hypothetical protein
MLSCMTNTATVIVSHHTSFYPVVVLSLINHRLPFIFHSPSLDLLLFYSSTCIPFKRLICLFLYIPSLFTFHSSLLPKPRSFMLFYVFMLCCVLFLFLVLVYLDLVVSVVCLFIDSDPLLLCLSIAIPVLCCVDFHTVACVYDTDKNKQYSLSFLVFVAIV